MPFDRSFAMKACKASPLFGALLAISAGVAMADTGTKFMVSQRGRAFLPGAMTIRQGDTLEVINDDGDLMHHAYIDEPTFSFDSGDQEPGAKADILFTKAGTFSVLCGIHPKMKLVVTVRE
jgi:plastocyanin